MHQFDIPELKERFTTALAVLSEIVSDYHESAEELLDPSELITMHSETNGLMIRGAQKSIIATVSEIIYVASQISSAKITDETCVSSTEESVFFVRPIDSRSETLLSVHGVIPFIETNFSLLDSEFNVKLSGDSLLFSSVIVREDMHHNDLIPSHCENYAYISVCHPRGATNESIRDILEAFIFEVACCYSILLQVEKFPEEFEGYIDDDEAYEEAISVKQVRVPMIGAGMKELHQLYNSAMRADTNQRLLLLGQIFEFIGATVVRQTIHRELRSMLLSSEALNPSLAFLDNLTDVIETVSKQNRPDAAVVELVITSCCEPVSFAGSASPNLRQLSNISPQSREEEKRQALKELAGCLSATRNQLSHAKVNYNTKGGECPSEHLEAFCICVAKAAEQAIRYFNTIPSDLRLV